MVPLCGSARAQAPAFPGLPPVPDTAAPNATAGPAPLGAPADATDQTPPSSPAVFVVRDIRVQGLQRISEGTVFNYLPVNIGDRLNPQRVGEALRALYATGFFSDVELRREGDTLVVVVKERPSIESIDLKGNKDIKTEDLNKALRGLGLSAGKTFDRSTLDGVTQELTDQYFSRGKYDVQIDAKVVPLPDNRVRISINITEGARAKIRQIDIVGNTIFKDKEILSTLSLQTPTLFNMFSDKDRYARETLQGDLEKIQAYFQDRGYANARLNSVQVAISPDKKDIFITVNITEGDLYHLGAVKLAGNLIVPEPDLQRLLLVHPGQIYSQHLISVTEDAIKNRLGAEGFYFAKVEPVPTLDDAHKIVALTLFVDPGDRVYVRHINFTGTTRTNDETFRREMRQLEAAWLSNLALDRSKQRLEQRPYVESVDTSTTQVPGSPDQVDVDFAIKERAASSVSGGIGYSAYEKFVLNGSLSDTNFLGSGDQVALSLDAGLYNKVYSVRETNPFTTVDGLSRTIALSYADSTQLYAQSSAFGSKNITLAMTLGYPLTEYQFLSGGVSLQSVNLLTYEQGSARQAIDWVEQNGRPYQGTEVSSFIEPDGSTVSTDTSVLGSRFDTAELSLNYVYTSLNRGLFANQGVRNLLSFVYVPPGLDVRYLLGSYQFSGYLPLIHGWTLSENAQLSYGKPLGSTTALPPYKRYFAGGPDSVRGYLEDTLGPVDTNGNPYGGNLMTVSQTELIIPTPAKWETSARASLFFDIGNVFSTDKTTFLGKDLVTPVTYNFSYHDLKKSVGISVEWLAPVVGLFRFSLGIPLNASEGDLVHFEDRTEEFQFTVGQSF
ncbi:MAG TPA: outer membrane protein assembly factor BamA [Steroidobacteraceae bacterium]|nr:outer membrane protein assembly factor BamA [Steroidobacteraceae bacterium]